MKSRTLRNDAGSNLHAAGSLLIAVRREPASNVLIKHEAAIATRRRGRVAQNGRHVGTPRHINNVKAAPIRRRMCRSRQHSLQNQILENEAMIKRAGDMQADQGQQRPRKITVYVAHFMTDARAHRRNRRIRQQTGELYRPATRAVRQGGAKRQFTPVKPGGPRRFCGFRHVRSGVNPKNGSYPRVET